MGNCCTNRKDNEQINPPPIKSIIKNTNTNKLKYKIQKYNKKERNTKILAVANGVSGTLLIVIMIASGPVSVPIVISSSVLYTSSIVFYSENKDCQYKLKLYNNELNKRQKILK